MNGLLTAVAAAATLAVTVASAGASTPYLSLQQAHTAALRSARQTEVYIDNHSTNGVMLSHPLASCKNGQLSPTVVACVQSWVFEAPRFHGDTVFLEQPVHVSLVRGQVSVAKSAKPCAWDKTTGVYSGNCG
jgi:hypothetical protein